MTTWFFFALSAPIIWAFTNVLDRALTKNYIKNEFAITWLMILTKLPLFLLFFAVGGMHVPPLTPTLYLFLGGILWTTPFYLYFKAMQKEEASRISILVQLTPLFAMIFAYFLIHEVLGPMQLIAFALILFGGILASLKWQKASLKLSSAFWLIMFASASWALSDIIFKKFEPNFANYSSAFAFYLLGGFIPSAFIFFIRDKQKTIFSHFKNQPLHCWVYLIIDVVASLIGSAFMAYALTLGKASLTTALIGTQPLFVFLYGIILCRILPGIEKEDLKLNALAFKIIALILVIAGFLFLNL